MLIISNDKNIVRIINYLIFNFFHIILQLSYSVEIKDIEKDI